MATTNELSQRLAGLSPEKQALLQKKLMEKRAAAAAAQVIPRRAIKSPCPLSFGQELMWLLDQLTPGLSSYNVPSAFRIQGPLDVAALHRALNALVARHEILRTSYDSVDGKPVQIIADEATVEFRDIDLRQLPAAEREAQCQQLISEIADYPFDLRRPVLPYAALLRLTNDEAIFMFVQHHITSDGWSRGVLFNELRALYGAFATGQPARLPELSIQYADFALWQRNWLQGEVSERLLSYWKKQLEGAPPLLELPTDHPRPPMPSGHGQRCRKPLPRQLARALKDMSHREGTTLFMTALAAFKVLLYRYTRQETIVIGTPISGRTRTEVEGLLGYFSNSLALRTDLSGELSFRQLLQRVRDELLGAFSHQEMPFEKLVVELNPQRDLSYAPIYQVMFGVVTPIMENLYLPGLNVVGLLGDRGTAKFDLSFGMLDLPEETRVGMEYNSDLFEPDTAQRLLGHYHTLLEGILANPDERLDRLPLLTPAERRQILVDWNTTRRDAYPVTTPLHQLVEAQAARTPEAVAVVSSGQRLTYRELNERANQVAHFLRQSGVVPGTFVAVLLERGADFVIAMLGTFKAGGAYVPVDPNYPRDRVEYLLSNSESPVVLTRSAILERSPDLLDSCPSLRTILCFDRLSSDAGLTGTAGQRTVHDASALAELPRDNPANVNRPTDLLYMIYTSGSTGTPKGAMIRHDGAINHIYAQFDALALGGEFAFLQSAPSSSDISVWQFLAPLVAGGRTVVIDDEGLLNPARLFQTIQGNRCTIIELVPVLWKALMDHVAGLPAEERSLPDLRWMMVTGESAPVEMVNAWFQLYPNVRVVNAYGPTEAADDIAQHILDGPLSADRLSVPIGKPLANLNLFIVNEQMQLNPIGVPGEICVSGIGVGEGYWKNDDKTRHSFVPNPFPGTLGKTIYRTGDLGKWLPDGSIEFLGRIDHQVKIRGFRIELGEVEAALGKHPAVREAVVIAREDRPGDRRLVAYVVAHPEQASVNGELRQFLKESLPAHMVPSAFVVMPQLPLAPSGKVDRRALPSPEEAGVTGEETFVAPRTPVEEMLAAIWIEVLKVERVGVLDNFFELGGHSLMATQVVSRVRDTFQIELGLRQMFEAPTVAELAVMVVEHMADQAAAGEAADDGWGGAMGG